ncbi:hypothetical protein ACFYOT_16425 [Saccharothrix saharensis]|uniref:hypothetical protein n=1 Tax=Saccharothrix saharensis TaxID=571190 RepID=UPI0036C40310
MVEMVPADQNTWDRHVAAQWLSTRRWLEEHPDDEPAPVLRASRARDIGDGETRYGRNARRDDDCARVESAFLRSMR